MGLPHPLKNGNGRIIDYNTFLISFPMLISGVAFGVMLNIIIPEEVITIFYVIVVVILGSYISYKAY